MKTSIWRELIKFNSIILGIIILFILIEKYYFPWVYTSLLIPLIITFVFFFNLIFLVLRWSLDRVFDNNNRRLNIRRRIYTFYLVTGIIVILYFFIINVNYLNKNADRIRPVYEEKQEECCKLTLPA